MVEFFDCMLLLCYVDVFQSVSTFYSSLNIKKLLAQNRRDIWNLNDSNGFLTHNHLVCKRTLNHLRTKCRHFSHVTKSRIFKNLNLRKKADRNFRGNFLKNHLSHLKFYSDLPSWLDRSRCHMGTFWKTKDWSSHFWKSQHFRVWYEVHHQRRLKSTKTGIPS